MIDLWSVDETHRKLIMDRFEKQFGKPVGFLVCMKECITTLAGAGSAGSLFLDPVLPDPFLYPCPHPLSYCVCDFPNRAPLMLVCKDAAAIVIIQYSTEGLYMTPLFMLVMCKP